MRLLVASALFSVLSVTAANAQVELKTYADKDGYIDVQTLTCAQLAGTFQEDADLLTTWYSGWYNGLGKKHFINIARSQRGRARDDRVLQSQSRRQNHQGDRDGDRPDAQGEGDRDLQIMRTDQRGHRTTAAGRI